MSRTSRHALINKILARGSVASQRQLRDLLAEQGVYTTQATLSRDLLELRAVKVRTPLRTIRICSSRTLAPPASCQ